MSLSSDQLFKSKSAQKRYMERYQLRESAWPVPSTSRFLETSFGETYLRLSGPEDAPVLLMLPGIGSPGLSLAPLVKGLSTRLRTITIDNIHDNGRSIESRPVTSADDFTQWLDEVVLGLGLTRVSLLGLSYGGWISAHYALRFPEKVDKVVLLAPAGTTAPIPWGFIWRAILCLIPVKYFMRSFMAWMANELHPSEEGKRIIEEMTDDAYLAHQSFKARKMVPPIPLTDEQWRAYRSKTLFLAGDREVNFPPKEALEKLKRLAPHIEAALLPGAGHDLFVMRADEITQKIFAFFGLA